MLPSWEQDGEGYKNREHFQSMNIIEKNKQSMSVTLEASIVLIWIVSSRIAKH